MRWLALQFLHFLHLAAFWAFIGFCWWWLDDPDSDAGHFFVGCLVISGYAYVIEEGKRRLRRRMFQQPKKVRTPPPQPIAMPKAKPVPAAPQKPAERRLAPPPMVEAVEHELTTPVSSLPANMRAFIGQGEKAISMKP